jgi:hypothetical protein
VLLYFVSYQEYLNISRKQFSLKCIRSSIVLSFLSFFLMSFPTVAWKVVIIYKYGLLPIDFYYNTLELNNSIIITIIILFLIFTLIVFPLDFVGVGVTRNLVSRVSNDVSLKSALRILLLDTLVKAVIFPLISIFSCVPILVAVVKSVKYFANIDRPTSAARSYPCRFLQRPRPRLCR